MFKHRLTINRVNDYWIGRYGLQTEIMDRLIRLFNVFGDGARERAQGKEKKEIFPFVDAKCSECERLHWSGCTVVYRMKGLFAVYNR